ncbi:MAG: nuclear transport factor 2 family protein [Frankia sp.]|nr:nuclear transport factor 2 family protein [Frankia sp.]
MAHWELVAREQVRDTIATYNHSGDRGRLADLAACFTPDGVLEARDLWVARGREEIIARLSGVEEKTAATAAGTARPAFVRHHVTNLRFESVTPERITTAAYFAVLTPAGLDHWGRYRDVLVPYEGRWLIAHRVVRTDAFAPGSPFASAQ